MSAAASIAPSRRPFVHRIVLALLASLALVAGPLSAPPASAAPGDSATVSGTIVVPGGDDPGSEVTLERKYDDGEGTYSWYVDDGVYSEDGAYSFDDVDPGTYRVKSGGPRVGDDSDTPYAVEVSESFDIDGTDMTVAPLAFRIGGTVSGSVTTAGATPIAGVTVAAERLENGRYSEERSWTSDATGAYTVSGLRDGTYRLEFSKAGFVSAYLGEDGDTDFTTVTIDELDDVNDQDVALARAAKVSGTVTASAGSMFSIAVTAYERVDDGFGAYWDRTSYQADLDQSGAYSLFLPPGAYRIGFEDFSGTNAREFFNDKLSVTSPGVTTFDLVNGQEVTANATLARAGTITGTIVGPSGDVVGDSCAYAYPKVGGTYDEQINDVGLKYLNDDTYIISGLAPGSYKVKLADCSEESGLAPEYFDNKSTLAAATEITVTAGETVQDIDGSLARPPVVTPPVVVPPAPVTPPAVVKVSPSVKVAAKAGKKKATLTITVRAAGVTPTGKVTIKLGSKRLKVVTLRNGKAKVTLTKQKKGKRVYSVAYSGDSRVLAKTVKTKKVSVK